MTRNQQASVVITPAAKDSVLSKVQQTFNRLIKQIEQRRAKLREWETVTPGIQDKVVDELVPMTKKLGSMPSRFVHALDRVHAQKGLTKTERGLLSDIMAEIAGDLIADAAPGLIQARNSTIGTKHAMYLSMP